MRSGKYIINTLSKSLLVLTFGFSISVGVFILYYLEGESLFGDPRLAGVSSISIEGTPVEGERCTISIHGVLGHCCRLEYHEKKIYEQDKLVNISLWESCYSGGLCTCNVVEFQYNISIIFPSSGNWTIRCNRIAVNITVLD